MATVPISDRSTIITLASASAGPFDLTFRLFDEDGLNVYVNGAARTDFTLTTAFIDGFDDNATITFDAPLAIADVITIDSDLTPRRADDNLNGPGLVEKTNIEFARLWSTVQDLKRDTERSVKSFTKTDPITLEADRVFIVSSGGDDVVLGPSAGEIEQAQAFAATAQAAAAEAEAVFIELVPSATTLATGQPATVSYDPETREIDFGLPKGDKGDKGNTGDTGPAGTGVNPKGRVANEAALPTSPTPDEGDYYITDDTGNQWVYVDGVWTDFGQFVGLDGDSAYDIAVAEGFVGNEAAWLASLEGAMGPPGPDGEDGADGGPFTYATKTAANDFLTANAQADGITIFAAGAPYVTRSGSTVITGLSDVDPSHPLTPKHFGANTTPGTTDMTTILTDLIGYAETLTDRGDVFALGRSGIQVDLEGGLYAVSAPLSIDKPITFKNGSLLALPAFTGGNGYILSTTVQAESAFISNVDFDGGLTDNGGGSYTRHADLIRCETRRIHMENIRGVHFPNYGLRMVEGQEAVVSNSAFREWNFSEAGTTDETLRAAKALSVETSDAQFSNVTLAQSLVPLYVNGSLNLFAGCHMYNGGDAGIGEVLSVQIDQTANASPNNAFTGCYFDNGNFEILVGSNHPVATTITGCVFQRTAVTGNTKGIRIVSGSTDEDLDGLAVTGCRFNGSYAGGELALEGAGTYTTTPFLKVNWAGNHRNDGGIPWRSLHVPYTLSTATDKIQMLSGGDVATLAANRGIKISVDDDNNTGGGAGRELTIDVGNTTRVKVDDTGAIVTGLLTGTAVTQSATDTTASRLLKVGDYGEGTPITVTDFNNATTPGRYYIATSPTPTNAPSVTVTIWTMLVLRAQNSQNLTQIAYSPATGERWTRSRNGGTFNAWVRDFTGRNVRGAVTQASGVPTGGLWQSTNGTNEGFQANADGNLVAWKIVTPNLAITTQQAFTYPAGMPAFVNTMASASLSASLSHFIAAPNPALRYSNIDGIVGFVSPAEWGLKLIATGSPVSTAADKVILRVEGRWFV